MIKRKNVGNVLQGTLSELTARTTIDPIGTFYEPSDSDELRVSDGIHDFANLMSIPAGALQEAVKIVGFGSTTSTSALAVVAATISASAAALSTSNTYSDASVKTAIDGAVDALKAKVITALALKAENAATETARGIFETRLDNVEAKINAVLAALTTANLMSAS